MGTRESRALYVLSDDLKKCEGRLHGEDCQFWRRMYVRTWFSYVDATSFWLRETTLAAMVENLEGLAKIGTLGLLAPVRMRISDNGMTTVGEQKERFAPYVAFSMRCAAEQFGVEEVEFGDRGWKAFLDAVKVRDRITHPKDTSDVDITDIELQGIGTAVQWFEETHVRLADACVRGFLQRYGGLVKPEDLRANGAK
jgi:hypothetical protein